MIDDRTPEEPPPVHEGIGLPTPPSPGRIPPIDLPTETEPYASPSVDGTRSPIRDDSGRLT